MKSLSPLMLMALVGFPSQGGIVVAHEAIRSEALGRSGEVRRPKGKSATGLELHDLHVSYGNLGIEGPVAVLQIRIFKDDLEEALRRSVGAETFRMEASPEADAVFLRYLSERFVLEVSGDSLPGRILGSGEDELDREPVWWYQIQYGASEPISSARITNTILFEVFQDQSNVLRVVKFPEERRSAYYFAPGEETREITFGG